MFVIQHSRSNFHTLDQWFLTGRARTLRGGGGLRNLENDSFIKLASVTVI